MVAVYQYMRLCGYAAEDISILTTYNGQKHLIRDIVQQVRSREYQVPACPLLRSTFSVHLLQRCSPYPFFGNPAHITTVDRFQGQQNKYILLSLVRTKSVGHLRDARRLVVAVRTNPKSRNAVMRHSCFPSSTPDTFQMSRAKLGLYVFGRVALFEQCAELSPVMSLLLKKPTKLQLVGGEHFPAKRKVSAQPLRVMFLGSLSLHLISAFCPLRVAPVAVALQVDAKVSQPYDIEDVAHMGYMVHQMSTAAAEGQSQ